MESMVEVRLNCTLRLLRPLVLSYTFALFAIVCLFVCLCKFGRRQIVSKSTFTYTF